MKGIKELFDLKNHLLVYFKHVQVELYKKKNSGQSEHTRRPNGALETINIVKFCNFHVVIL